MSRGEDNPYTRRFAELFEQFYEEFLAWLKPRVDRKDLRFGRIIPIERAIDATPGLGVLALSTDRYSEAVDRNRVFCLMHACSCRHERDLLGKGCGRPKDVCSAMGALADFAVNNGLGRRVSRQEFLEAKQRAAEAGLVNLTDNLRDPMQVCSCCGCCCGALRILTQFNIPSIIAQSHFAAVIEAKKCRGCRSCERVCPMKAIQVKRKKASLDPARCIGCGLCVLKCDQNRAIRLKERESYLPPSETLGDYALSRFLEVKGLNTALAQRLSLGAGRLIARVSPLHLTGPKYRSQ
jgi:NAD-dependent dihydropyrimidine dehydrogenase PreA subunit